MQSFGSVINSGRLSQQLSTDNCDKNLNNNCQLTTDNTNSNINKALADYADLITDQWRPWYAKQARRIGVDRFRGIASEARCKDNPACYFSASLKAAV